MKTNRNFFFQPMLLTLAAVLFFSLSPAKAVTLPKFESLYDVYKKPPIVFPCYQIVSNISSDNSQITFWVQGYYSYTEVYVVPAPTYITVTITFTNPGTGSSTMYAPINSGVSTVTYPTGAPSSLPGAYYNLTAVSPTSYSTYPIYFNSTTTYLH